MGLGFSAISFIAPRAISHITSSMPFAAATKPWSHVNESDYMGKMAVTHRVHASFWDRNYEEEFWSYCRDMEDVLSKAEKAGAKVTSRSPSYVPALAKRFRSQYINGLRVCVRRIAGSYILHIIYIVYYIGAGL